MSGFNMAVRWVSYKLMVGVLMPGNSTLDRVLVTIKQGYITNCMHVSVID